MKTATTTPHPTNGVAAQDPPGIGSRFENEAVAGPAHRKAGLFLSFEGIDGAGKSSHIESLALEFRRRGAQVVQTREPGGTTLAETLRNIVLNESMDSLTEALLMFAARRDHISQVIAPALAAGKVVICDRFTDSTFAYQGGGRGFDLSTLTALERMVQDATVREAAGRGGSLDSGSLLQPDLTLLFLLDPAIAAQRLAGARAPDRFEQQPLDFFKAVAQGYAARSTAEPHRFGIVQADQAREDVWRTVVDLIENRGLFAHASHAATAHALKAPR